MGRKVSGLRINPKKFGSLQKPCMKEMITLLNCLALCHNNDEKCVRQKQLLGTCMEAQAGKNKKPWGSINYHLQRLNRGRK
ncbi:37S ribosomal protein mrp10 mitochondrial [Bienertia sinuspersici]